MDFQNEYKDKTSEELVEELLKELQAIESNESLEKVKYLGDQFEGLPDSERETKYKKLFGRADWLANDILIEAVLNHDFKTLAVFRDAGYNIYPIEKDSFGWLVGGISTSKGTLTFG